MELRRFRAAIARRVILIKMSSGDAFAYSTKTSKYRSSSKMPVSSNSYSNSFRRAAPVGLDQIRVGVCLLRILVEILHVGVRRRASRDRNNTP